MGFVVGFQAFIRFYVRGCMWFSRVQSGFIRVIQGLYQVDTRLCQGFSRCSVGGLEFWFGGAATSLGLQGLRAWVLRV